MSTRLAARTRTGVPIVNLLPPEYADREALRRLQVKLAGAVVLAFVILFGVYLNAVEGVNSQRSQLDRQRVEAADLAVEEAKYADVPATRARLQAAQGTLARAMTHEIRWSCYLRDLSASVPQDVWLTELTGTVTAADSGGAPAAVAEGGLGTVTFLGRAVQYDDVADWLDALEKQRGYANAWSSDLKKEVVEGRAYVGFTSSVTLTEAAFGQTSTCSA